MPTAALADWLRRLESFSPHEIELGLERVAAVLERLSLPRPAHVLHVAGTNGKGSTVALCEALMRSSMRVGSYTSPHIVDYNERIRIDGQSASDADIVAAFEAVERVRGDTPLTYFEYGTLAALVVFAQHEVDAAILEVGMGGRLDAVNAVEPDAGLITNVALDHCAWLGEDVEAIGREKAGIMRPGKATVFADSACPQSVREHAERIGANLLLAGRDYRWSVSDDGRTWRWSGREHSFDELDFPGLPGAIQVRNAAGALALLEAAGFDALLDRDLVAANWVPLTLPGRLQTIVDDRHWCVDVAHNPAAAAQLAVQLRERPVAGDNVLVIGLLDDKDAEGIIAELAPHIDRYIAVTADSPRALPVEELARRVANASGSACLEAGTVEQGLAQARLETRSEDRIVVTGSFHVVGPALQTLGIYSPGEGQFHG